MKKLQDFLKSQYQLPPVRGKYPKGGMGVMKQAGMDEIVVNDYGVLHMVYKQFPALQKIWGNFLSGQNKDPYLKDFVDKSEHRHLSIDSLYYSHLFTEYRVQNIEIYNVFQGMEIRENF